MLMQMGPQRA
jgi:hypothetical protein